MELYITELSKYFITLFMALYTLECFLVFRYQDEESRSGCYFRQSLFMFLVHFSCFLVICFETGNIEYLFFYVLQQILMFATVMLFRMVYPKGNRLIVNNMCLLLSIGFVILTRLSFEKAIKQFFIVTISIVAGMLIPYFIHKLKFLKNLPWIYAAFGIVALGIVLVLGAVTYGSKISYSIAGVTFQPSEFVKIVFVFFLASALHESHDLPRVILTSVLAGIHVLILVASRDLGSALIFFIVYVMMVFIATGRWIYLLLGCAGGSGAAVLAYRFFCADFLAKAVCLVCFLLLPTTNVRPAVEGNGLWEGLVRFLYQVDAPVNLFPSVHCLVSWLCWIGVREREDIPRWYRYFSFWIAVAICLSTLTTKQHVIVDVAGGITLAEASWWAAGLEPVFRKYAQTADRFSRRIAHVLPVRE